MKNKIFALFMTTCMCVGMLGTIVFASDGVGVSDNHSDLANGGARPTMTRLALTVNTGLIDAPTETVEEQLAALETSDLTAEQKAVAYEKLTQEGSAKEVTSRAATTWSYLDGFMIWKQSESYYCVPASCKAAMNYLTGSSDSQATIANAMGTTTSGTPFANAKTYLNNNQSSNTYISRDYDTALSTLQTNLYSAINTYNAPPLISVKLSTANGWAYDTSGHTMLISGARSDKEEFRVADPYIQWEDSSANMFYSKSSSAIRTAIYNRGNGYIF